MSKKSRFFKICLVSIVILEIIGGSLLVWEFSTSREKVLGAQAHVVPLKKENFQFPQDTDLKYYYEPEPSANETVDFTSQGLKAVYTINQDSLNERSDYSINKNGDTFRIITLGDSFTFGLYVNTAENWPEKLEDLLNSNLQCKNIKKFEVINLGVPGYDIEYSKERFKRKGINYNPDLVVWFMRDDDFDQINEKMIPIKDSCEEQEKVRGNNNMFDLKHPEKLYDCWYESNQKIVKEFGRDKMNEYLTSRFMSFLSFYENPLIIIDFPFEAKEFKQLINEFTQKRENISFFDQLTDIYHLGQALPDGHPNVKAYTFIANDVFQYLTSKKIIQCDN